MSCYLALLKTEQEEVYHYVGTVKGETPLDAAVSLSEAIQGWDSDTFSDMEECLAEFIDAGYRFRLLEAATDVGGEPIEYDNTEIA